MINKIYLSKYCLFEYYYKCLYNENKNIHKYKE